jgi:hypothetical protein
MAPLTFRNEDEEAQFCLSTLRDGTRDDKVVARERLAAIFARRGLFEEAAELYELNIRAGVRSPEVFERLSAVYRHLGDHESAEAALDESRRRRASGHAAPDPIPDRSRSPQVASVEADTARLPIEHASDLTPHAPEQTPLSQDEASGRSGRSVPGPLLVIGVILFMIVLPVLLLALLVVNPLGLYLEGKPAGPLADVGASEPTRLKIAPGMSATWYLQTGHSVSGLWATPGLDLSLTEAVAGVGSPFTITGSRSQSWGETITIVERRGQGRANQETIVSATVAAPAELPPAGTVLHGRIAGEITAPRLNESGQFTTTTQSVDHPVELEVVSGLDLWLDRFSNALRMFFDGDRWLLVTIGAILIWCVLAGSAALFFRARPR